MNKQRQCNTQATQQQRGAVAIIVAICLALLVGMLGLVLDLGHLYVAKTELQNAADAAALSGAERLDGTKCRVNSALSGCDASTKGAVQFAIETAGKNNYDLNAKPVTITANNLWIGSCPDRDRPGDPDTDDCTMVPIADIDTDAEAAGMSFLKVDTLSRTLNTWFAQIWSIAQTQTFGMAVAGRYITPIAPVAVCALDNSHETQYVSEDGNWPKYLAEWGFRRGTAYELGSINQFAGAPPGILSGDQLYVHPTAKSKDECQGNPPDMPPFLCGGKSTLDGSIGSKVYANTGFQTGPSVTALNTRFGTNASPSCPADTDTTQFLPSCKGASSATNTKWMICQDDDRPATQSVIVDLAARLTDPSLNIPQFSKPSGPPSSRGILERAEDQNRETGGCSGDCSDNYGVLWSYSRPTKKLTADADPVNAVPGDWSSLYYGGVLPATSPSYVGALPWVAKYSGNGRRIINTLIVNCSAVVGSGSCAEIPVLGVGRFFLQTEVSHGGGSGGTNIYGEFDRLLPQPLPPAQIRLYW